MSKFFFFYLRNTIEVKIKPLFPTDPNVFLYLNYREAQQSAFYYFAHNLVLQFLYFGFFLYYFS